MTRIYTPLHEDPNLNNDWFAAKGLTLGVDFFYNAIRDGSGRFDGYVLPIGEHPNREIHLLRTVIEAEEILRLREEDE